LRRRWGMGQFNKEWELRTTFPKIIAKLNYGNPLLAIGSIMIKKVANLPN